MPVLDDRGFPRYGRDRFSGGCSILFCIAQLIGMAMISLAFADLVRRLGAQRAPRE